MIDVIEIPASTGQPYTLGISAKGYIRLARQIDRSDRHVFLMFNRADALAVSNALVDLAESPETTH